MKPVTPLQTEAPARNIDLRRTLVLQMVEATQDLGRLRRRRTIIGQ